MLLKVFLPLLTLGLNFEVASLHLPETASDFSVLAKGKDWEFGRCGRQIPIDAATPVVADDPNQLYERAVTLPSRPYVTPWPNATVRYKYVSTLAIDDLRQTLDAAFALWQSKAPYLKFEELPPSTKPEVGVLIVTNFCLPCSTTVGYRNTSLAMNMNLRIDKYGCDGSCVTLDRATHEVGHAIGKKVDPNVAVNSFIFFLGFSHEHQRQDRDKYVSYECKNLDPDCISLPTGQDCCNYTGTSCCLGRTEYEINNVTVNEYWGQYDIKSIMHYRSNRFALPGKDTLVGKKGLVVPTERGPEPSNEDFARVCKMYKAQCGK